jgi:hypothetical protein
MDVNSFNQQQKIERDYLRTSRVGCAIRELVKCGQVVDEANGVTASERIREVCISQLKMIATVASLGIGRNGTICGKLDCENMFELDMDNVDISRAICGTLALLEYGSTLAEETRAVDLEDSANEAAKGDDDSSADNDPVLETGETAFGMPVITLEQLDAARAKAENEVES